MSTDITEQQYKLFILFSVCTLGDIMNMQLIQMHHRLAIDMLECQFIEDLHLLIDWFPIDCIFYLECLDTIQNKTVGCIFKQSYHHDKIVDTKHKNVILSVRISLERERTVDDQ